MRTLLGGHNVCLVITECVPGLENSQGTGQKVPGESRAAVPPKCWPLLERRSGQMGQELRRKLTESLHVQAEPPDSLWRGSLKVLSSWNNAPRCL